MAQGLGKLSAKKKPARLGKAKNVKKGRRTIQPKRKHAMGCKETMLTSKAIDRKNEANIAAKAVASGTNFFLADISKSGSSKLATQIKQRNKKQGAANHLQKQLQKLQR